MNNRISPAEARYHAQRVIDTAPAVPISWEGCRRAGRAGDPRLVERLDQPGIAYFLVPWLVDGGEVGLIKLEAESGRLLGFSTYSKPGKGKLLSLPESEALVRRQYPGQNVRSQRLVWQPCRQSTSPYLPFAEVVIDDRFVFVTMDGEVLEELTPLGFGGG